MDERKQKIAKIGDSGVEFWLGKVKQALTMYKEDVRQKLRKFNPEN